MSRSIEILITKKLESNWRTELVNKLNSDCDLTFELTKLDESFNIISIPDKHVIIHLWLSQKERTIFPDSSYLSGMKSPKEFDYKSFFDEFKTIDYTVMVESKPPRIKNDLLNLCRIAKLMGELGDGILTFDQEIEGFSPNQIYYPSDISIE